MRFADVPRARNAASRLRTETAAAAAGKLLNAPVRNKVCSLGAPVLWSLVSKRSLEEFQEMLNAILWEEPVGQANAEEFQRAISAEGALSCHHQKLAAYINNGRVKQECLFFSREDKMIKNELFGYCESIGLNGAYQQGIDPLYLLNPEEFSLIGMLNLGLEINSETIAIYRFLLKGVIARQDKEFFARLLKAKFRERKFLEREKRFHGCLCLTGHLNKQVDFSFVNVFIH